MSLDFTWASVDIDLCRHMASFGHNELNDHQGILVHPPRLFDQQLTQADIKSHMEAPHDWSFVKEIHWWSVDSRWTGIPFTKNQKCGSCFHFMTSSCWRVMNCTPLNDIQNIYLWAFKCFFSEFTLRIHFASKYPKPGCSQNRSARPRGLGSIVEVIFGNNMLGSI